MKKILTPQQAAALIPDGASIMFSGFIGCRSPHRVITEIAGQGTKNRTMICNDASKANGADGSDYYGVAEHIHNRQVSRLIATHVGTNPEVAEQMNAQTLDVTLIPQGSFAEMIRAGGAGLGGVLTRFCLSYVLPKETSMPRVVQTDFGAYRAYRRKIRLQKSPVESFFLRQKNNSDRT